jgi:small conductance mechanosensitive channel
VKDILPAISSLLPSLMTLVFGIAILALADRLLIRRLVSRGGKPNTARRQLVMIALTLLVTVSLILSLPVEMAVRNELLGLLGIVVTGIIAFSSTTFVANMMAGLMLRSVKSFNPGDFIQAGNDFGKVTEQGLFHTEIQSEDRDLITLPNLYLASNPFKVVRSSGTVLHCNLSLGYDVPHRQVEKLLKQAALAAELEDPFVQIIELGDFAVTYKAAGFYRNVEHLLTVRSLFKGAILDALHGAGIEIVSPSFMNQRVLQQEAQFIPEAVQDELEMGASQIFPEALLFDKADRAQKIEMLKAKRASLKEELKTVEKGQDDPEVKEGLCKTLEYQIDIAERLLEREKAKE